MTTSQAASAAATMLMRMSRDERKLVAETLLSDVGDDRLHRAVFTLCVESTRRLAKAKPADGLDDLMDLLGMKRNSP